MLSSMRKVGVGLAAGLICLAGVVPGLTASADAHGVHARTTQSPPC